jgi:threonine aldolase
VVAVSFLVFKLTPEAPDAATLVERCKKRGVLVMAFGVRTIRAVTHLDVSAAQCAQAAEVLVELAQA